MIPNIYEDDLIQDYIVVSQLTRTYRLNFQGRPSSGMIDGLEAMKQAIFLILSTERFQYEIYSWNYGAELEGKIGRPNTPLLQAQIKEAITEAIMMDARVLSVADFMFERTGKSHLGLSFTVRTTEGDVPLSLLWADGGMEVRM